MTAIIKAQFRDRLTRDLAERSLPGIPAYIAVWSVIVFATGFHQSHAFVAYAAWLGFLLVSTLRLVYQFTYRGLYQYSPGLNYSLFLVSIMAPAGLWSGLFVYSIVGPNTDGIRLVMVMATAGLCSGAMTSFAPDRQIAVSYLMVLMLPACISVIGFNREEMPLFYLVMVYIGFILLQLARGNREYWSALENEAALAEKTRQLEDISKIDALTRIFNRRHFNQVFHKEWKRGSRSKRTLTLIMVDIDHFKHINDTFGHLAGDDYLKSVAETLKTTFQRCTDVSARYGGEEFAVLLPETAPVDALALAESLRQKIADLRVKSGRAVLQTTVSLGIAGCIPDHQIPPEHLISLADKALYQAKSGGRNQVRCGETTAFVANEQHKGGAGQVLPAFRNVAPVSTAGK